MYLKQIILISISLNILGCGFMSDTSYDDDVASDRRIVEELIRVNPVLDSAVKAGHYFLPYNSESGRITGDLDLHNLNLNDSNFHFPMSVRNLRRVSTVLLSSNNFTDLPSGTRQKSWERVVVWDNEMCNPDQETIKYLDKLMEGYFGGYWRDSQRCNDSVPVASP